MDQSWLAENEVERCRLFDLIARLTADDLGRSLPNGWTVATSLAHLAIWDQYCLAAICEWERNGFATYRINIDALNEAVRVLSDAIPPATAVELARKAAEAIDQKIAALSPDMTAAIETSDYTRMLRRALHRRHHLDQIKQALGSAAHHTSGTQRH